MRTRSSSGVFVERGQKQQNGSTPRESAWLRRTYPARTGNDYGDLLVGRPTAYFQQTAIPHMEWRFWNLEGYAQDSWKARRNLTIDAGLRVAKMTNNEERNGLGMLFEPDSYDPTEGPFIGNDPDRPNGVLRASLGQIPNGMTRDPGVAFMPRLNVAWSARGDGASSAGRGRALLQPAPGQLPDFAGSQPLNTYNAWAWTLDAPGA